MCIEDSPLFGGSHPYIQGMSFTRSSAPLGLFDRPYAENNRYAIDEISVSIFNIVESWATQYDFIFGSENLYNHGCLRYTAVSFSTNHSEAIEVFPVENWRYVAGSDAVREFDRLTDECIGLPRDEILNRYGDTGFRIRDGSIERVSDLAEICDAVVSAHSYAMRIRGPDGEFVFSSINGEIFAEGLN
jgi:hypothetical protein